jgi:uncharacterized coiled-coil protein SlyX
MMADNDALDRLERKVDRLTDAVMRLVLIEERQSTQGERIGALEQRAAAHETTMQKTERKVEQWINRGIGAWAIAVLLFVLVEFGLKHLR